MHQIRDVLNNTIINGDIHKLKQVVRNIISNALKFTRGDGIVTINLTIDYKESCNCNNAVDDSEHQQQQQQLNQEHRVIDFIDDLTRSNKINPSSMNNDNKYFLKMTVKDNGPGITKVMNNLRIHDNCDINDV